jgi:DNA polymerase-1
MDNDFLSQIPIIQNIIKELWIVSQIAPWFEADDVLASFVNHYKSSDLEMYIYSADKDLKQLLTDWVFIVDPVKDLPYQKKDFLAEFWFEPQYIVDYLALLWDNADNIKWVTWIWEKKAQSLVQHYGSIENIYNHLNELDNSESSILWSQKDDAFFSKKMIQLANVDLSDTQLENFKFNFDWNKYINIICNENGLNWLMKPLTEMKKEFEKPQQLGLF